jgi:hypothetical protein
MMQITINIPHLVELRHTGRQPWTCPIVPTADYSNSGSRLQCFHVCWQQCLRHLHQALSTEQRAALAATRPLVSPPTDITEYTLNDTNPVLPIGMWSSTERIESVSQSSDLFSGILDQKYPESQEREPWQSQLFGNCNTDILHWNSAHLFNIRGPCVALL